MPLPALYPASRHAYVNVMEIRLADKRKYATGLGYLLAIFRRLVALFLLWFGLMYWMRIVGLSGVEGLRFDTMTEAWQAASCVMAVMLPIAAIGLWGLFTWGTSIWLITVAVELSLYLGWPEIFGQATQVVWFHAVCLAVYVTIKLMMMLSRRRIRLPRRSTAN